MEIKPMERIWEKVWPDYWPRSIEYGRESIVWHLYHNAVRFKQTRHHFYGNEITTKNSRIWSGRLQADCVNWEFRKVTVFTWPWRIALSL